MIQREPLKSPPTRCRADYGSVLYCDTAQVLLAYHRDGDIAVIDGKLFLSHLLWRRRYSRGEKGSLCGVGC
ncbi:hypothetical protein DPEC_G00233330 [Dallia pectoralis]|uniref:Uncharacterized protein n=1 Tax=Dallia pectoralis TaxID=75939 RepID=A0ACC2FXT2_DALPE|nr:hypothetical protein DPEC_G00233330 [Dallia pectoralis]